MNELDEAVESATHDHFYVVKIKNVCYDAEGESEEYAEYEYRISPLVADLPGPDTDLGFLGFTADYDTEGNKCESYVCTDIRPVDIGSRTHKQLKKNLSKEPWERKAGGL